MITRSETFKATATSCEGDFLSFSMAFRFILYTRSQSKTLIDTVQSNKSLREGASRRKCMVLRWVWRLTTRGRGGPAIAPSTTTTTSATKLSRLRNSLHRLVSSKSKFRCALNTRIAVKLFTNTTVLGEKIHLSGYYKRTLPPAGELDASGAQKKTTNTDHTTLVNLTLRPPPSM